MGIGREFDESRCVLQDISIFLIERLSVTLTNIDQRPCLHHVLDKLAARA